MEALIADLLATGIRNGDTYRSGEAVTSAPAPSSWLYRKMRRFVSLFSFPTALFVLGGGGVHAQEWESRGRTAYSAYAAAVPVMDFPYADVEARLVYTCESGDRWPRCWRGGCVWIGFTTRIDTTDTTVPDEIIQGDRAAIAPYLVGGEANADGYSTFSITTATDGVEIEAFRVVQRRGENMLVFRPPRAVAGGYPDSHNRELRKAWTEGNIFAVSLPWYGKQGVRFSWSLKGAAAALNRACPK